MLTPPHCLTLSLILTRTDCLIPGLKTGSLSNRFSPAFPPRRLSKDRKMLFSAGIHQGPSAAALIKDRAALCFFVLECGISMPNKTRHRLHSVLVSSSPPPASLLVLKTRKKRKLEIDSATHQDDKIQSQLQICSGWSGANL